MKGQTSKRVLAPADKEGICVLYGECSQDAEFSSEGGRRIFPSRIEPIQIGLCWIIIGLLTLF